MNTQQLTPFRLVGEQVKVQFGTEMDRSWSVEKSTNVPCTIIAAKDVVGGKLYLVQKNDDSGYVGLATESQDDEQHGWGELHCTAGRRLGVAAQGWSAPTVLAAAKAVFEF